MANHESAKKRARQDARRRERNRSERSTCRTAVKATRAAVEGGDLAAADELLRKAQKILATAARKGVFHDRNVSRRISRLAKLVADAKAKPQQAGA